MTQTPLPTSEAKGALPAEGAATGASAPATASRVPGRPPPRKRFTLAPNWLQVALIVGLLGAAVFVALDERYLWASLLAVAGLAFGASYLLRRMVGDEYDRA